MPDIQGGSNNFSGKLFIAGILILKVYKTKKYRGIGIVMTSKATRLFPDIDFAALRHPSLSLYPSLPKFDRAPHQKGNGREIYIINVFLRQPEHPLGKMDYW